MRSGFTLQKNLVLLQLTSTEMFHTNGSFASRRYQQVLRSNYITAQEFEAEQVNEILRQKAKAVVRESTILTTREMDIVRAIKLPEEKVKPNDTPTPEQMLLTALFRKQQRAVLAFQESMKAEAEITIRHELL